MVPDLHCVSMAYEKIAIKKFQCSDGADGFESLQEKTTTELAYSTIPSSARR